MATFSLPSVSFAVVLSIASLTPAHGQDAGCVSITSLDGATPAVSYENNVLTIRIQGKFRQQGDLSTFTGSLSNGATVFYRELPAGTGYTVSLSENGIKVCIHPSAQAGQNSTPLPQSAPQQVQHPPVVQQFPPVHTPPSASPGGSGQPSSSGGTTTGATGSTNKPTTCLQDPVTCDIGATLQAISAPESPAFTVLGISPKNVTRPTSPTDFATALLNGFDDRGNFQSGLALDVAPVFVLARNTSIWAHYGDRRRQYWWVRPLARTTFSFGTTKGASTADPALRLATGFRVVLFDERDPRLLFATCMQDFVPDLNLSDDENRKALLAKRTECTTKKNQIWNATSLVIAGAPTWISKDGTTANMQLNGGAFWTSAAMRLQTWGQIAGQFLRRTGEQVPSPTAPKTTPGGQAIFVDQGSTLGGGSFRIGSAQFNGNVEGLYVHKRIAGVADTYPEFGFGLERKLAENFYLDASYRFATGTKLAASGFLANLKWSFSKEPKLKGPGGQ